MPLGEWLVNQRQQYAKGKLSPQRIKALEEVGMVWSLGTRHKWEDWMREATLYRQEFGNLLVPMSYVTPNGFPLGKWICQQRNKYKCRNDYSPVHKQQLDSLDMVWSKKELKKHEDEFLNDELPADGNTETSQ